MHEFLYLYTSSPTLIHTRTTLQPIIGAEPAAQDSNRINPNRDPLPGAEPSDPPGPAALAIFPGEDGERVNISREAHLEPH